MICPRCKNNDTSFFATLNGRYYCRKCIRFGQVFIDQDSTDIITSKTSKGYYKLDYTLSKEQDSISQEIVHRYLNKQDTIVRAVCGAGKTEIVYEVIQFALQKGHRVCFTTPRTELTKELHQRIINQFFDVTINLVCGGHTNEINGQLIVCTTHQLYRFVNSFDLLILDEYDAFPYNGDSILEQMLLKSVKGNIVYMSATMDGPDALQLSKRYHGNLIPVPRFVLSPYYISLLLCIYRIKTFIKQNKPTLVYVSAIERTYQINKLFDMFSIKSSIVHSKTADGILCLDKLKNNTINVIICTTILERGVTIDNAQVIVLESEHKIFDQRTLIQIAGRVGRKKNHPKGDVLFYGVFKTKAIRQCILSIIQDNVSVV